MTINRKIYTFLQKKLNILSLIELKAFNIRKFNPLVFLSFIVVFSGVFFISSNLINIENEKNIKNFNEVTKSTDFSNFTNFLISKINSPYREVNYIIKNNDTVEKILKSYKVRNEDINIISVKLKEKNSQIYILAEIFH